MLWVTVATVTADLPRAIDLAAWVDGLELDLGRDTKFSDKISGVKFSANKFECDDFSLGKMDAAYDEAAGAVRIELGNIGADCKGKFDYRKNSFIKGDGKLSIDVKDTKVAVHLVLGKDALGNPTTLKFENCEANIEIKKIKVSGAGAISSIASKFSKRFEGYFEKALEKYACSMFEDQLMDASWLAESFSQCLDPSLRKQGAARPADEAHWIDWAEFLAVESDTDDAALREKRESELKTLIAGGLQLLKDNGLPLAGDDALSLDDFDFDWKGEAGSRIPIDGVALSIEDASVVSTGGALADLVGAALEELTASAELPGGALIDLGVALPAAAGFGGSARVTVEPQIAADLGAYVKQRALAPALKFVVELATSVAGPISLDLLATAGVSRDTRTTCLGNVQELRLDEIDMGMDLAPVRVASSTFVPRGVFSWVAPASDFVLENALAEQLFPAVMEFVEAQFHPFLQCALDSTIRAEGRDAATDALQELAAPLLDLLRPDCSPPTSEPTPMPSTRTCPGDQVWTECGTMCEPTCEEPNPACVRMCVLDVCQCPGGTVLVDGDKCVEPEACETPEPPATDQPAPARPTPSTQPTLPLRSDAAAEAKTNGNGKKNAAQGLGLGASSLIAAAAAALLWA